MEIISKTNDNNDQKHNNIARKRWAILGNALKKRQSRPCDCDGSKRQFVSFGVLTIGDHVIGNAEKWTNYSYSVNGVKHEASFCELPENLNPLTLCGFNNTGNVCIWPSEEILAKYCLDRLEMFKGKNICELGGGMTCLAGVLLSTSNLPKSIYLTDGNEESVKNINSILTRNKDKLQCNNVKPGVLRWDKEESYPSEKYDYIIISDCLFFEEFHAALVTCLTQLLVTKGQCIIMAPHRGESCEAFLKLITEDHLFKLKISSDNYDPTIYDLHNKFKKEMEFKYEPNIHYPHLHVLEKQ